MGLILGRKAGEKIVVGADDDEHKVEITVLSIDDKYVRLDFVASPHVKIDRLEVRRQKRAAETQPAQSA